MDASLETSAFASAVRLWTSRLCELKRSEPARGSISFAEADWILHWSKTASVNPANKHSPNLFGRFATLCPSTVNDRTTRFNETDLSQCRVSVAPRHDGRLADRGLPDWGLADRHLAECSLLIDGLWVREVGSASGSHHGKRRTGYNHDFHHGTSPLG
jgi:hypothetical protein